MSSKLIDMFNESEVIYVSDILNDSFNSRQLALEREATVVVQIPKGFMASVSQNRQTEVAVFVDASNTLTSNYAMLAVNVCAATMKAGIQIEAQKKKGCRVISPVSNMSRLKPRSSNRISEAVTICILCFPGY